MNELSHAPTRHRLDVDAFFRMAEAGIVGRRDRIELIDGELIDMAPIGQSHEGLVIGLTDGLAQACQGRALVSVQNSIRLDQWNMPQPDFAILRRRPDFYMTGSRPTPADVLLVIEVADTSMQYDRAIKLPLYARAGIPEYWIVDIKGRKLEAWYCPTPEGYAKHTTHGPDGTLTLSQDREIAIPLSLLGLLPEPPPE